MFIKITKTHHRALDPRTTKTFHINDVHEFEEELAQDFIKNGFAIEHKELKQKIENKAILELPEIKGEIVEPQEEAKIELDEPTESLESKEEVVEPSEEKPVVKKPAKEKKLTIK